MPVRALATSGKVSHKSACYPPVFGVIGHICAEFQGNFSAGMCRINTCMRMSELTGPKTPDQLRMDTLRATQKRASNAVKMERNRQKVHSAQKAIQQLRAPKLTTLEPIKPVGSH
jgi:hypothetical protein